MRDDAPCDGPSSTSDSDPQLDAESVSPESDSAESELASLVACESGTGLLPELDVEGRSKGALTRGGVGAIAEWGRPARTAFWIGEAGGLMVLLLCMFSSQCTVAPPASVGNCPY